MISEKAHREAQEKLKGLVYRLEREAEVHDVLKQAVSSGQSIDDAVSDTEAAYRKGIEALKEGSEGIMMLCGLGLLLFGGSAIGVYFTFGGAVAAASLAGVLGMVSLVGFIVSLTRVREVNAMQRKFEARLASAAESLRES